MNFIKTEMAYYEQLTYPDRSTQESWLIGIREHRAIYVQQLNITKEGIETYWGTIKKRLFFTPNIDVAQSALIGGIATDYGLKEMGFQTIKQLPGWDLSPTESIAFELVSNPESLSLSLTPWQENEQKECLLWVTRQMFQYSNRKSPISIQILFKPIKPRFNLDPHKFQNKSPPMRAEFTPQDPWLEKKRGREFGYWLVTARVLASSDMVGLNGVLNKSFKFKSINPKEAIWKYQQMKFGKQVKMSSITLNRLVRVPTGNIFSPERLNAITTGVMGETGRSYSIKAFPKSGYFIGTGLSNETICLDDNMLRKHILVTGMTGSWKTSLMRHLVVELNQNPINRLLIFDYAGEYSQCIDKLWPCILLRPGSEAFPLGINFLDWPQTLGVDPLVAESLILKVLNTLTRNRGTEFSPKMESMLRDLIGKQLSQNGDLFQLMYDLDILRTKMTAAKAKIAKKKIKGEALNESEILILQDIGRNDLTIEALQNRLRDLYGSPLREVFFVKRTTLNIADLLENNVIIDLSTLMRRESSRDLLRLLSEVLLLYMPQ